MRCCRHEWASMGVRLSLLPATSLFFAQRWAKSRSIDYKNDPFGEKAAWEDPSMYGAFQKFDEAAFATAAASQELTGKHFGPDWARYSTIGKFAAGALQHGDAPAMSSDDLHEREYHRKAKTMEHNYETYEEFLDAEQRRKVNREASSPDTSSGQAVGELEEEVLAADRDVTGYRMQQTDRASSNRRESVLAEADEDDGLDTANVPLPSFVSSSDAALKTSQMDEADVSAGETRMSQQILTEESSDRAVEPGGISESDPLQWGTEDIIAWLKRVTPDHEGCVMDESMCDAFRMMHVTGDMLLNRVNPNTLFKHMRRWHLKRKQCETPNALESLLRDVRAEGAVNLQLVQETIYLCYPYCR